MFTITRARLPSIPINFRKRGRQGCSSRGFAEVVTRLSEEVVVYPTILDMSPDAQERRRNEVWYNKIKNINTVEEKIFEINMPWYYGWKAAYIQEQDVKDASLDHVQFATRTHLIPGGTLPSYYDTEMDANNVKDIVQRIKPQITDVFQCELSKIPKGTSEENLEYVKKLVYQLNRIILSNACLGYPHLLTTDIDFEPRLEAFWMIGNIDSPVYLKKRRAKRSNDAKHIYKPIDLPIQYVGSPVLHLRHQHPLKEFISLEEVEHIEKQVPEFLYDPRCLGYPLKRQHATNIPGYWPGAQPSFGTLSFNSTSHLLEPFIITQPHPDIVKVQAILASYAWLHTQACYLGFSTFQDITYPLTSQMVLTDGVRFNLCTYQMNTTLVHSDHSVNNPKANLCWITEPMELFELDSDNCLKDINDHVLESIVKFYVNEPTEKKNVQMQPYLGQSEKRIADIGDDERRIWLDRQFKHLMSNRSRHKMIPEIFHWMKFFIIDNKHRHLKGNRESVRDRTLVRRLDDHLPRYIPKILRENPKKKKVGRWEKTFYP